MLFPLIVWHPVLLQVYEDRLAVHIVMELCVGGELFERIVSKGTFSEADAARHFRRMVEMVGGSAGRGRGCGQGAAQGRWLAARDRRHTGGRLVQWKAGGLSLNVVLAQTLPWHTSGCGGAVV